MSLFDYGIFLSVQQFFLTWTDMIFPAQNIVRSLLYLEMTRQRVIGSLRCLRCMIFFKGVWTSPYAAALYLNVAMMEPIVRQLRALLRMLEECAQSRNIRFA
jgi:hypothetical protein